jgi:DNA invertase Pin-like site-specific DNA recombinase
MLKRNLDLHRQYRYVDYRRMSSDLQNPRSPDQQSDVIEQTIKRGGYRWKRVGSYTDRAISGRYVQKRPEFQRMLRDICSGTLKIDLILVDTWERFGRAGELAELRRELEQKYGVLVLTADSQFADPTTTSGKVLAAFEAIRSTDDLRIKAHNVLRGLRDAVLLHQWPGGSPAFGFKLQSVLVERDGRQQVDHSILVPNPETAWITQKLFVTAQAKGWGATRLTRSLNEDPAIPAKHKPFIVGTVDSWLCNPIYYGELIWGEHCTGVIDDVRVIQRNAEEDILRVPGFCEAIVSREQWEAVQELRGARAERARRAYEARRRDNSKQIAPLTPGLALVYPLNGLVRCRHCNRAMVCTSSSYTTRAGLAHRYAAYACPGYRGRICTNSKRVPERQLRQAVFNLLRMRLLPLVDQMDIQPRPNRPAFAGDDGNAMEGIGEVPPWTAENLHRTPWFNSLTRQVEDEVERLFGESSGQRPDLEHALQESDSKIRGWSQTLSNPNLSSAARAVIEADLEQTLAERDEIEWQLNGHEAAREQYRKAVDPQQAADRLNRLAEALAADNPTRTNLMLSALIDSIRCSSDCRILVRICRLGAMPGAVALLSASGGSESHPAPAEPGVYQATPRRRGRLQVASRDDQGNDLRADLLAASDVHRFAGLTKDWFWEDELQLPAKVCWSEAHADAVRAKRAETSWSLAALAKHFGKSKSMIAKALRIANEQQKHGG